MKPHLYMGIDIGTSVAKGTVINDIGEIITQQTYNRKHISHSLNKYEHNPDLVWWKEFKFIVKNMIDNLEGAVKNVQCLAITGMVPNIYPIDKQGRSLHKAILYYDPRAKNIEKKLDEELNTKKYQNQVLAMLIWLKSKLGSDWVKVDKIMTTHNYIVKKLTNGLYVDTVTALEYGNIFDSNKMTWNRDLLGKYDIQENIFPEIIPPGTVVGKVTREAAKITGLKEGTSVIAGTSDTISSFLGAGARHKNELLIYYGTYNCAPLLLYDMKEIIFNTKLTYPIEWVASIKRAGQQLSALAQQFCLSRNLEKSLLKLDKLASSSKPGANNVIFVQELNLLTASESTEPQATLFNLGLNTTISDICRAMLEAFGYGLKYSFESVETTISPIKCFAAGGGARSQIWKQIVSDITGLEQIYFPFANRAYGSAILAAVSDDYDNMKKITGTQSRNFEIISPNFERKEVYDKAYSRYISFIEKHQGE